MRLHVYLREQKGVLCLMLFMIVFPAMVIWASEEVSFLESNACYSMVVSSVLGVMYLGYDYRKKKRYYSQLKRLEELEDIHMSLQLPKANNSERRQYEKLFHQLDECYEKLIREMKSKEIEDRDFTENWVHEMKTPIAAMKLMIEKGMDEPNETVLFELSDQIIRIEDMVQKTICYNQINDFSRDCQMERVNVEQVFKKCLRTEYTYIHHKGIQLEWGQLDFEVNSDEKWLGFIIKQVLDNAIKYSHEKGCIKVNGRNEINHQEILIEDFGIGIKGEDKRRLFEKGFTGGNGRKAMESTGVGLYLAYKLARKLGHQLEIKSEFGKGTKVKIKLGNHEK